MNRIYIVFILLFLTHIASVSALPPAALEEGLESLSGTKKVDTLLALAKLQLVDSSEKALVFCLQAAKLAGQINYRHGEGLAAFYLGKIYLASDEFDTALKYNQNAFRIFQGNNNDTMIASTEIELGLTCFMKPDLEQAIDHYNQALELYEQLNDSMGISTAYYNLGRCYRKTGKLDLALDYSLNSLQFNKEKNHNALNTISIIYAIKGDLEKAFEYQEMALAIREKLGLQEEVIGSLNNLGLISIRTKKLEKGLEYLLRSAKIAEEIGKKSQLNRTLNNIGFLYDDFFNESEKALQYFQRSLKVSEEINDKFEAANTLINIGLLQSKLKNYDSALVNLEKGLTLAKEIKANEFIKNGYISISQHYERIGDYRQALENYKSFVAIKDSIFSKESKDRIAEMQIKYETEKTETENEIYKLQIEKQSLQKNRLYFGLILLFIFIVFIYFRYLLKNKSNKRLKKEIQEREKTEESLRLANDDLNAFSYSVSHDLRAPLRALGGFANAIIENYSSEIDPEGQRLLHLIPANVIKMNRLIEDLLTFSRVGRQNINYTTIDMNSMVRGICNELVPDPEKEKIQFNVMQLPQSLGDPSLIRQVWINLISNALKFSSGKSSRTITIGTREEDKEQIYFVRDNGVGFDMNYADQLFKVFQRLHSINEFEGSGVGLAIVQKIIQRHSGKVWAEAEVNNGATFYFSFPR